MPATRVLRRDEPVYTLVEVDLVPPDFGPKHRYQLIYVNRDDRIAEFKKDLGLATDFTAQEFRILTFWQHSVAECLDMAESQRNQGYWEKVAEEIQAESTLVTDFYEAQEEALKQIANQSTFGPLITRQRNLVSRGA